MFLGCLQIDSCNNNITLFFTRANMRSSLQSFPPSVVKSVEELFRKEELNETDLYFKSCKKSLG